MLVMFLSSCELYKTPINKTIFIVEKIDYEETGMASYFIKPLNAGNLNCKPFWICDTIGAFSVSEKVIITKYKK